MKKQTKIMIIIIIIISILLSSILIIWNLFDKKVENTLTMLEIQIEETTDKTTTTTKKVKKIKTNKKLTKKKVVKKVKTASNSEYQQYAKSYGNYDDTQMSCLINLWNRESGWNPNSYNKSSGACGIPQALPCNKISKSEGSNDWKAQIRWGIKYISARYKIPCNAWKHFQKKHWY